MMREISLDEARPIWNRLVPEKELWTDDWDIRVALCRAFGGEPLILYDGRNFFPLQYDREDGFYSILGGESSERNYLTFDPDFMKATGDIPEDIYFDFLADRFDGCVEGLCPQFFIDLANIGGIEDYVKRFSGKHRKNFMAELRKFGSYEFVKRGGLDELAALNRRRFGDRSDFAGEGAATYSILDRDPRTEYWSIMKGGDAAAVVQLFFCGRAMSVCSWGAEGLHGNPMRAILAASISLAKGRGCARVDFAPTYAPWKLLFRLDTAPLWRYKRGDIPDSVDAAEYGIPRPGVPPPPP